MDLLQGEFSSVDQPVHQWGRAHSVGAGSHQALQQGEAGLFPAFFHVCSDLAYTVKAGKSVHFLMEINFFLKKLRFYFLKISIVWA
jgi:hypothetical protein